MPTSPAITGSTAAVNKSEVNKSKSKFNPNAKKEVSVNKTEAKFQWLNLDNAKLIKHLVQEEKLDMYFEKQYRRYNANHKNDPKALRSMDVTVQPSGKPDGNFKLNLKYWQTPVLTPKA